MDQKTIVEFYVLLDRYEICLNNIFFWLKFEMYEQRHNYGQPDSYINGQEIRYTDVLLINQVRKRSGATEYTTSSGRKGCKPSAQRTSTKQLELNISVNQEKGLT